MPEGERPRPAADADYWARFRRFINRCNEARLERMLRVVQRRIGTPEEHPEDVQHAQEIAHRLRNLLTAVNLRAELPGFIERLARETRTRRDNPPGESPGPG